MAPRLSGDPVPALSLTLCGRIAVTIDGAPPAGAPLGNKGLALLAYLALEPGPHSREELTTLLWGEYPEAKAKASLRQALTHLRDTLGDAVRVDRASVELPGPVECDVARFLQLASVEPQQAAESDVSRFLSDLHARRCPGFDEWVATKRATVLRRYREVLAAATRDALAARRWRDASRLAARWVDADPLSTAASSALVESLYLGGDATAALEAFADYAARLSTETGRTPDRPMVELVGRIRSSANRAPARLLTGEWPAPAPSFEASLVGRAAEWEALSAAWRNVRSGKGRVVLIEGEAGTGKTRLAADFLLWVSSQGGTVLRGRGHDSRRGVPLGAVIEALRSGIDAPGLAGTDPQWLAEVSRVLPELRQRFPALPEQVPSTPADGWRLFEGIAQLLLAVAEEAPVAVLIDDLHWSDAQSGALIHFLIRRFDEASVLWCLTFTPGAVERDAEAARLVRALHARAQVVTLPLGPLTADQVDELLRALGIAGDLASRLTSQIHEMTAGYPFYIIELLKTLFAHEWLAVDPATGQWVVRPDTSNGVSLTLPLHTVGPSVHRAIAERIECLPEELRAVLITIAVSEGGCRTDVLSHVHGISRLRAAAMADALVERHLVVEEGDVYRCAHPVIARVVRDGLGASRRREVHRSLALALELVTSSTGSAADLGDIARHAEQAGERQMAHRFAILAAAACETRFAFEDALAWLDLAAAQATSSVEEDAANQATSRLLDSDRASIIGTRPSGLGTRRGGAEVPMSR